MKITRVSTDGVEASYEWTFVRIEVVNGIPGLRERFCAPGLTGHLRNASGLPAGGGSRAELPRPFIRPGRTRVPPAPRPGPGRRDVGARRRDGPGKGCPGE